MQCQQWCFERWQSSMCGCSRVSSPTEESVTAAAAITAASAATVGAVAVHAVTNGKDTQPAQPSAPEASNNDAAAAPMPEVEFDGDAAGIVVPESALEQVPIRQHARSLWAQASSVARTLSQLVVSIRPSNQVMACRYCFSSQIALWEEYSCKLEQRVHALTHENDTLQRQIAGVQDTLAAAGGTSTPHILCTFWVCGAHALIKHLQHCVEWTLVSCG